MKTKRMISLLLAVLLTLSVAVTPAFAASAGDLLPAAESADVEESNDVVSIRLTTSGELVYGSPFTLSVVTKPADTQYIGVVIGTKGEAKGYVTLVLSDKIRTLLKMIPLPRKMSATPDQQEEFNLYAYIKQLIDGNDVSVLLRVADEVVSVMDVLQFYMPTIKDVSTGLKLALALIRKFLPDGAFSRIYVDEQPTESGNYVAGAVALESGDVNTAGVAMFRIKPKCMVGGLRDAFMLKDFHLLYGFVAIFVVTLVGNLAMGKFHLGFALQPIAHSAHLWNLLGMVLVGWGSVLLGGCPLRQLILAAQGNGDSAVTVFGMIVGAALAHNFGLAGNPDSKSEAGELIVGGISNAGKIAVVLGLVVMLVVVILNLPKKEEAKA